MKTKISLSIIILMIFVSGNCLINSKFNIPHQLYMKSNYVMAIKHFDDFLETSDNGALSTQAELERSDCYYQLGVKAYDNRNWLLASRLFFLSNSSIADDKLDDCYFELAKKQLLEHSLTSALEYYHNIVTYIQDSEYIPEILYNRIKIYIEMGNNLSAFNDYHFLWENHPDNSYRLEIQPFIDDLMPSFIDEALSFRDSLNYDIAVDMLKKLSQYPSTFQGNIFIHISDLYLLKFDEAIEIYKNCYKILPEYQVCTTLINEVNDKKKSYLSALEFENIAMQYEEKKEYTPAYSNYNKSYNLFKTDRVRDKIYIMSNLIQAERNPKAFAEKIVKDCKKGVIPAGVNAVESSLVAQYGDQVSTSGWKVYYAIGEFKYEVRFDLLSPGENYYYAWRVNLKTRQITSLNKISEDMMKR